MKEKKSLQKSDFNLKFNNFQSFFDGKPLTVDEIKFLSNANELFKLCINKEYVQN